VCCCGNAPRQLEQDRRRRAASLPPAGVSRYGRSHAGFRHFDPRSSENLCRRQAGAGRGQPGSAARADFRAAGPQWRGQVDADQHPVGHGPQVGGSAEIWGFDTDANPRNAKRSIGIVPQEILFDPFFTPFETLELQAGLYGIPKSERRSLELLRAVRLEDKADAYSRTLSGA
jgi:ABC-2 type transport system ATP-binding protein